MDSRLINAMVADFGLDLLQFNDEIRMGTAVVPPHKNKAKDKNQTADLEYIKNIYSEASKSPNGRSMLEVNAMVMADRIQEHVFARTSEEMPFVSGAFEIFLKKHGIDLPPFESKDEKVLNRRLRYLSFEESATLLNSCDKHLKPIVTLALNTGCRRGEILGLTWDRVDLKHGFILLDDIDTKSGKRREIPITCNRPGRPSGYSKTA